MNVNPIIYRLEEVTGLPVAQDIYDGKKSQYIVFNYEDEAPVNWGDNRPLTDAVWLQVALYTPPDVNYMKLKHQIRDYLEANGFKVTSTTSWLDALSDGKRIRHTAISAETVGGHKYEEE